MCFSPLRTRALVLALAASGGAMGCKRAPARTPGETDVKVTSVVLRSANGRKLTPPTADFINRLGMRKRALLFPTRYYGSFREAEDRRRIVSFWQTYGFFDVKVDEPRVERTGDEKVAITWTIAEGKRYRVASVELEQAPPQFEADLREMIYFEPGFRDIQLERMRKVRVTMQDHLRREGHYHAVVYSRTWVDPDEQEIHWRYYVDAGPETEVGKVVVLGNVKVPDEVIEERVGLSPGDPLSTATRLDREFDLLDSGAFASAFIRAEPTPRFLVPGDAPNDGGELKPEQVDQTGKLVPRDLPKQMSLKVHVVEAPSQQVRLRASVEFDSTRIDTALSGQLWLRNALGPFHHITLDGRIGYGWLWRDESNDPTGLYGDVTLRYIKAMALGRLVDFRFTNRYRDELFPGFHLREATVGPGLRTKIKPGLYFDLDTYFRWAEQVDFGPFSAEEQDDFRLAEDDTFVGGELQTSLIYDRRDNPVEAMDGFLVGARSAFSPGGVDRWNRYLTANPLARLFIPLSRLDDGPDWTLALRAEGKWVFLDDQGIPLGPRVFAGGAYSMRGFGRHRFSPQFPREDCVDPNDASTCDEIIVGGRSLVEGGFEFRWLPPLKPYGAVVFGDVGGVDESLNPFADGVSFAPGVGLRLRLWYLPAAFDFSYRLVRDSEVQRPADDPFLVFFRVGEAF
ncbi:MAG: BamA/TamA family outer membrane protein [Myxococcota bacterium]